MIRRTLAQLLVGALLTGSLPAPLASAADRTVWVAASDLAPAPLVTPPDSAPPDEYFEEVSAPVDFPEVPEGAGIEAVPIEVPRDLPAPEVDPADDSRPSVALVTDPPVPGIQRGPQDRTASRSLQEVQPPEAPQAIVAQAPDEYSEAVARAAETGPPVLPRLSVRPSVLRFALTPDGVLPASQSLEISSDRRTGARFAVSASGDWLVVESALGRAGLRATPVQVAVDGRRVDGPLSGVVEVRSLDDPSDVRRIAVEVEQATPGRPLRSFDAEGRLQRVVRPNGGILDYDYDSRGNLVGVRRPDGSAATWSYDDQGRRIAMTDQRGTTAYRYDAQGRLNSVYTPGFDPVRYVYDDRNLLTTLHLPGGRVVAYEFDEEDRLLSVRSDLGTTRYAYDAVSQKLAERVLPSGVATRYGYDAAGRLTGISHLGPSGDLLLSFAWRLDELGRPISVGRESATGREVTDLTYDPEGRIASVANSSGRIVTYEYDALGRRVRAVETEGADVRLVDYVYDDLGRLVRAGDEEFVYDVNGALARRTSPAGTREYRWDAEGRLTGFHDGEHQVDYAVDGDGRRVGMTVDGHEVSFLHDASGWIGGVLAEANGEGEVTRAHVHGLEPIAVEGAEGAGSFYLYDYPARASAALLSPAGELAATFRSDPFGALATPLDMALPPYLFAGGAYDPHSGLIHWNGDEYDPSLGASLSPSLDAPGAGSGDGTTSSPADWGGHVPGGAFAEALAAAIRPDRPLPADPRDEPTAGQSSGQDPPGASESLHVAIFQSNELPPPSERPSARRNQLPSRYRLAPEVGSVYRRGELPQLRSTPEPSRLKLHPEYLPFAKTASGLLPASQTLDVSSTDGGALSFTITEDIPWLSLNSAGGTTPTTLTVTVDPGGLTESGSPYVGDLVLTNTSDPTDVRKVRARLLVRSTGASVTLRSFDANGSLRRVVKPDGAIIDYEVDPLGRVTRVRYPDISPVSYAYDGNGNRVSMTDHRGTTIYQYDRQNRLIGVFTPLGENFIPVTYGYDKAGRMTRLSTPDGRTVFYEYDADGRMTRVTDGADVTTYTYDPISGLLAGQTLPNGITTAYTYDADGRLTDVVHNAPGGGLLMGFHYTLNALGQRTSVTKQTPTGSELTSYGYDALGRLDTVTYPNGKVVSYTYDPLGNRLSMTTVEGGNSTVVDYQYDMHNRLLRAGGEVFAYDPNGNMIRRTSSLEVTTYSYDVRNLLTQVETNGKLSTYEYDGDGSRIAKVVNGLRTHFVNDDSGISQVLVEANASWQVTRSFSYGPRRIAAISAQGRDFFLADNKSIVGLADGTGSITASYSYDAFGSLMSPIVASRDTFLYDSEYLDAETELIYLRHRSYMPELGRFISRDPFGGKTGRVSTLSPYVFVENDPINFRDPLGLCAFFGYSHVGACPGSDDVTFSTDAPISPVDFAALEHDLDYQQAAERGSTGFFDRLLLDVSLAGADFKLAGRAFRAIFDSSLPSESEYQTLLAHPVIKDYQAQGKSLPWLLNPPSQWPIRNSSPFAQIGDRGFSLAVSVFGITAGVAKLTLGSAVSIVGGVVSAAGSLLSSFFSDLGGVSLNKTADLLLALEDVTGATFDENTGQIILLGKENLALPPLDLNSVAVASHSVFAGQDPGVSIDPPIVNNQMSVRYEGQTRNTEFGQIMFEADRALKILSLGKDNITGQTVTSSVPGYKNMLRRRLDAGCAGTPTSTRMWFQPKEVRLVPSTDGRSMVFDAVSMELLYESKVGNQLVSDPVAAAFASHFTQNYDAFAAEWPILQELEQLGKVVAIVKWIKDNQIPIDLSFLDNFPIEFFSTVTSTPTVTVQGTKTIGPFTCTISLQGGVTYQVPNQYLPADPEAGAALAEALAERPSEETFLWTYQPSAGAAVLGSPTEPVTVVAQSLTRSRRGGNVRFQEADLAEPVTGGGELRLVRTYNSFYDKGGPLGPGWSVLPAELRFPLRKERFTFGSGNLAIDLYARIWVTETAAGREDAYDLLGIDGDSLPVYRRAGAMHLLLRQSDGTFRLMHEDGSAANFRADGKPLSLSDSNDNAVVCEYHSQVAERLLRLTATDGRAIELTYDSQGRLTQALGPGGREVLYGFDSEGRLASVTDFASRNRTYGYDNSGRLVTATDAEGRSVFSADYDDYDRTPERRIGAAAEFDLDFDLETSESTTVDPFGRASRQVYERRQLASPSGIRTEVYRPKETEDPLGNRATITWGDDAFGPRTLTDAQGAKTEMAWDNRGHLTAVRNPLDELTERFYDWRDRLIAVRDAEGLASGFNYDDVNNPTKVYHDVDLVLDEEGNLTGFYYDPANVSTFSYDPAGNLVSAANSLGQEAQEERNSKGQPTKVTSPGGVETTLDYDARSRLTSVLAAGRQTLYGYDTADRMATVTTAAGTTSVLRDPQGRVTRLTDPLSRATHFTHDTDGNLARVEDALGGVTTYSYDVLGRLLTASLPNATANAWEYDELGRPVAVLTGLGPVAPALAVTTNVLDFGTVPVGTSREKEIELLNQGTAPLTISGITVSAPFSVDFTGPETIGPAGSLRVIVAFAPTDEGPASANLSITSDDPGTPLHLVALTGEGARKVANLHATAREDGILLTWSQFIPGSQPFRHFNIYRSLEPIPGNVAGLTPFDSSLTNPTSTSFLDRLAVPATSYYYAITPVYANGDENKEADAAGPIAFFTTFGPVAPDAGLATAAQSENRPAMAFNSVANEYLVVYERQASASNTDVFGQRVTASGSLVGSAFAIANTAGRHERRPRLAYNANSNNFLVIWEFDTTGNGTNHDLRVRTVSATGALGSVVTVANSPRQDRAPEIAFGAASREYLAVLETDGNGDGKIDLGVLRLGATGALLDAFFLTLQNNSQFVHATDPALAYNGALNDFMLVFEIDTENDGSNIEIWEVRLRPDGTLVNTSIFILASTGARDSNPSLAYGSAQNDYLLTWQTDSVGDGENLDVSFRSVSATGSQGSSIANFSAATVSERNPRGTYNNNLDNFVIAWESGGAIPTITARRIRTTGGSLAWQAPVEVSSGASGRNWPDIGTSTVSNTFLVAWEEDAGAGNFNLRARLFGTFTPALQLSPSSLTFSDATTLQTLTITNSSPSGGPLQWLVTRDGGSPWMAVQPSSGSTTSSVAVEVEVDRRGLAPGSYQGTLHVASNDEDVDVPVTLIIGNTPPDAPSAPRPNDGSTNQASVSGGTDLTLGWQGGDADGDTVTWDVYLDTAPARVTALDPAVRIGQSLTVPSLQPANLAFLTSYFWRVVAIDARGGSTAGLAWQFSTTAVPPPVLIPVSPDPTSETRPELSWQPVTGAASYHLQVADNAGFSPTLIDAAGLSVTSFTPASALPEGVVFWRVRSVDAASQAGAFSAPDPFVIDTTAAGIPVLVPVTPDPTNDPQPVFAWGAVTGASSYHVQVTGDTGFTSPVLDETVSTLTFRPAFDLPEGAINWRVASLDEAGNESAFSSVDQFTLDVTPPPAVGGLTAHRQESGVSLTWQPLAGPLQDFARFRIYRSESSFTNVTGVPLLDESLTSAGATSFQDETATPGVAYWYAVTAVDTAGNEDREAAVAHVLANEPPAEPDLIAPVVGAQVLPSGTMTVLLSWSAADPENDPLRFEVYLSTDRAQVEGTPDITARIADGLETPVFEALGLTYQNTYYWRVVALDLAPDGAVRSATFGPLWSFAIPAIPAPVLTPLAPDPSNQLRPTLTWGSVPGAAGYRIEVSTEPTFGSTVVADEPTEASFTPVADLPESLLYWRVRSIDAQGLPGAYSAVDDFVLDATAPPVPALIPLTPDPTNSRRPSLGWDAVAEASTYRVQVSTAADFESTLIDTTVPASPFVSGSNLPEGRIYWRVASVDAAGNQSAFTAVDDFVVDATAPLVPVVVPVTPDPTNNRRPALGWGAVADASSYRVQVSTAPDFGSPSIDLTVANSPFVPGSNLPEVRIYWRVVSVDAAGNQSAFSAADDFMVDATAPAVPVLITVTPDPTNNRRPPLSWGTVADASSYRVQVSTAADFGSTLIDSTLAGSLLVPGVDLPESRIYWRVASLDAVGNLSAFSAADDFLVDTTAPAVPVVVSVTPDPTNNRRPALSWGAVAGASSYRVQVSTAADFGSTLIDTIAAGLPFVPGADLPEGQIYWRVASEDAVGNQSTFSTADDFVVDATAPAVPILIAVTPDPTNNRRPSLGWGAVAGASSYRVQVSTAVDFGSPLIDATAAGSPFVPGADLPEGQIYWRVASEDAVGNQSTFTTADDFVVDATAPAVPVLVPVTPDPTNSRRPSLGWGTVAGASSYRVQVSTAADFGSTLIDTIAAGSPFVPGADLPEGQIYWRVASEDAVGNQSAFTPPDDFLVDSTAPAVPVLVPVVPDPTSNRRPNLNWGAVSGASNYRVQVSTAADFGSTLIDTTVVGSPFVPGLDLPEVRIYWRVSSADAAGNQSAFPTSDDFLVDATAPAVPVLIPVTPDPTSNRRPSLSWGAVSGASNYRLQVSTASDFGSTLIDTTVTDSPFVPGLDLPENQIFWRVASVDGVGNQSAFPTADDFLVDATAPVVPVLVPVTPDPTNNRRPALAWVPVASASTYRVQVSTVADFGSTLIDTAVSAPPLVPSEDLPEGWIYWRVSSADSVPNQGPFSSADDFLVDATAPAMPVLVPVTPDPSSNRRPSLGWGLVADASSYRVQVSIVDDFASTLIDTTVVGSPLIPGVDLPVGRIYWRAGSADDAGNLSPFSSVDDFVVDPTAPVNMIFGDGFETGDTSRWTDAVSPSVAESGA